MSTLGYKFSDEQKNHMKKVLTELSPNAAQVIYRGKKYKSIRDLYYRCFFVYYPDYYTFRLYMSSAIKLSRLQNNGKT